MAKPNSNWTNGKGASGASAAGWSTRAPLLVGGRLVVLGLDRQRVLRRLGGHHRVRQRLQPLDQVVPLAGLEDRRGLGAELRVVAVHRMEADVDVVVVVGQRH